MEGLGSLGINLSTLIAQIINFVILFGLLYLVAYKPFMRMIDERSGKIKDSMAHTEYVREQTAKTEQEIARRMSEAGKEGQKIIAQANELGKQLRLKMQQEAEQEVGALIAKAQLEIQRERDEVAEELRQEFADLAVLAAGKLIDRSLDKKSHRQLIEKVLEESSSMKGS